MTYFPTATLLDVVRYLRGKCCTQVHGEQVLQYSDGPNRSYASYLIANLQRSFVRVEKRDCHAIMTAPDVLIVAYCTIRCFLQPIVSNRWGIQSLLHARRGHRVKIRDDVQLGREVRVEGCYHDLSTVVGMVSEILTQDEQHAESIVHVGCTVLHQMETSD